MGTATKELIMPGDSDYIALGVKEAEMYANPDDVRSAEISAPPSVTEGWEQRARDVQPGRGYNFAEGAGPARKVATTAGKAALFSDLDHSRRPYSNGMPYRQATNVLAQYVSREAFRF
jgi:hypothetical protein